jgi:predicted transcriptional regulator
MSAKTRTIEVDEATACALETLAAKWGLSVAELVAGMVGLESAPVALSSGELDGRWSAIKAGKPKVPHEDVARWLETWGTPDFNPWQSR